MLRRFGYCHFGLLSIFYNSENESAAVVNEFDDAVMRIDAGAKMLKYINCPIDFVQIMSIM